MSLGPPTYSLGPPNQKASWWIIHCLFLALPVSVAHTITHWTVLALPLSVLSVPRTCYNQFIFNKLQHIFLSRQKQRRTYARAVSLRSWSYSWTSELEVLLYKIPVGKRQKTWRNISWSQQTVWVEWCCCLLTALAKWCKLIRVQNSSTNNTVIYVRPAQSSLCPPKLRFLPTPSRPTSKNIFFNVLHRVWWRFLVICVTSENRELLIVTFGNKTLWNYLPPL